MQPFGSMFSWHTVDRDGVRRAIMALRQQRTLAGDSVFDEAYGAALTEICREKDDVRDALKILLECEVDATAFFADALHRACEAGNCDAISCLLDFGADVNCEFTGWLGTLRELGKRVKCFAFVYASLMGRGSPLHRAVCYEHADAVRLLCERHANVNGPAGGSYSPLHCACMTGNSEIVGFLLSRGADVEEFARGSFGDAYAPLVSASMTCHAHISAAVD